MPFFMHILAPISNIVLLTLNYFQDENNKKEVLKQLETMTTTELNVEDKVILKCIDNLIYSIKNQYQRVEFFATILDFFKTINNETISNIYEEELMNIVRNDQKNALDKWTSGFLSALYVVSRSNNFFQEKEIQYGEDIMHAIQYIESHGYKVKLQNG